MEDEIRQELMLLENQLAPRRKGKAMELSITGTITQGRSVGETIAFCPEEAATSNILRRETLPFIRGGGDPKRSEVEHVPVTEKGKNDEERLVLLAQPDANISGSKRKAVIPPLADTSICASDNISNKKAKAVPPHLTDTSICLSNISNYKTKGELARPRDSNTLSLWPPPMSRGRRYLVPWKKEKLNATSRLSHGVVTFQRGTSSVSHGVMSFQRGTNSASHGVMTLPFQRGTGDLKVSEVKPVNVTEKSKEKKAVLLAKANPNSRRKAVKPPLADRIKFPSSGSKNEMLWSCGLCQVKVAKESTLHMHLSGRKHKRKEEALQAQITGMIGSLPKARVSNNTVGIATDTHKPRDLSTENVDSPGNPKPVNLDSFLLV